MVDQNDTSKAPRKGGRKGKSGCRTCKIRKVKCGEERPGCYRCVSTGRKCDGYGICSSTYELIGLHVSNRQGSVHHFLNPLTDTVDSNLFEWYLCRASTKISGLYRSGFWQDLVVTASYSEPAVLRGTLALSSAHQLLPRQLQKSLCSGDITIAAEEMTLLKHYNDAIASLHGNLRLNGRGTIRTTLITCIVFIALECLCGRYQNAIDHLRHGSRLLEALSGNEYRDPVDAQLRGVISRLCIRAHIFGESSSLTILPRSFVDRRSALKSASEARTSLDELTIEILKLKSQFRDSTEAEAHLLAKQMRVGNRLTVWHSQYIALLRPESPTVMDRLRDHAILSQHAILQVLLATSLQSSTNTGIFDSYASSFLDIIFHSIQIQILVFKSGALEGTPFAHKPDVPKFSIDGFSIVPLFYTAIHCRDRYLRRQAVRLMEAAGSREAMWDANLMATVAREVISIEEKGLSRAEERRVKVHQMPEAENLGDLVPIKQRVWRLHIGLPNGLWDTTIIKCLRLSSAGHEEVISRVYDPMKGRWSTPPASLIKATNSATPLSTNLTRTRKT